MSHACVDPIHPSIHQLLTPPLYNNTPHHNPQTIFGSCRALVLRHGNAQQRSIYVAPPLVFLCAFINIYFIFTKGAKKTIQENVKGWTDNTSAWVALLIATVLALATWAGA